MKFVVPEFFSLYFFKPIQFSQQPAWFTQPRTSCGSSNFSLFSSNFWHSIPIILWYFMRCWKAASKASSFIWIRRGWRENSAHFVYSRRVESVVRGLKAKKLFPRRKFDAILRGKNTCLQKGVFFAPSPSRAPLVKCKLQNFLVEIINYYSNHRSCFQP